MVVWGLSLVSRSPLPLSFCWWWCASGWSQKGSHCLSVHLWHAPLLLSAPHPRKTSSLLWSSEFWQPLLCVLLDGVTWRTGTGWRGWPCGIQKCWLCCHLPCAVYSTSRNASCPSLPSSTVNLMDGSPVTTPYLHSQSVLYSHSLMKVAVWSLKRLNYCKTWASA